MADIGKAFRAQLLNATDVTGVIGQRVYRLFLPQNPTFGAVTIQQVSGRRESVMGDDTGDVEGTIQVDSWDKPGGNIGTLKNAVRDTLQRFSGTATGTTISDVYMESEIELWEDDLEAMRVSQDYRVWWRE